MGVGQKSVLWNAGENVGQLDLNNLQYFLRAFASDWQFGQSGSFSGFGDPGASGFDRTKALYCLGDAGAPFPTGVALQVTNLAGPIGQWTTGPAFPLATGALAPNWGLDPYMMVYWLSAGELITTHAAADPTNPRWDLVCVRLQDVSADGADLETRLQKQVVGGAFVISSAGFIKRRKVSLTKQVVAGTPAASPVIPAVPSGFQPLYAVLIPATFNAVFPIDDNFHDYRMPLGSFCVDMNASDMVNRRRSEVGFTFVNASPYGPVTVTNNNLDFVPNMPISPHSCRVIGVSGLTGFFVAPVTVNLGRFNIIGGGLYAPVGGNATWLMSNPMGDGGLLPATSGDYKWQTLRLTGEAGNSPPTAAIKPPWGTGRPSGYASRNDRSTADNIFNQVGVRYTVGAAASGTIVLFRLHFAGMPY